MEEKGEKADKFLNEKNKEEHEENLEEKDKEKVEEKIEDDADDFAGYSKIAKYQLFGLFFLLGIINHLGTILVLTGGRLLAYELNMQDYVTIYSSVATIFSVVTRIINSKLCLKVSYKKRVVIICFWMMAGYLSMFAVLQLHETVLHGKNALCFILSFIPCFFLGSSYAFGEAAMIAYLRLFPKTLIAGWSSGTGLSGMISGGLNLLSQILDGLSLKFLYLILTPVGFLYLIFFVWTYRILKSQERKIEKQRKLSIGGGVPLVRDSSVRPSQTDENEGKELTTPQKSEQLEVQTPDNEIKGGNENNDDEENDEKEDKKSIRANEDKELEEMNKKNQVISFANFLKVMDMAGRVIINLGFIYFLQFFCVNTLIIRVCSKVDISFMPLGCSANGHYYRKGKFEFINMTYQIGMFVSKTIIKLVRRIQPIEVYTFAIVIINVIYIIEYYTGIFDWGYFIPIGLILGFFSGGTYAGGFYAILNSDKVDKNYKELTVNIATVFNDTGTFLSGIIGFFALKSIFSDDSLFDNQIFPEKDKHCVPE